MLSAPQSDLYTWREIFQLYIEAEVFESMSEAHRGERTIEESEERLTQFAERVTTRGLGDRRKLKLSQSRAALETFLELNLFILNVKKVAMLVLAVFHSNMPAVSNGQFRSNQEDIEETREEDGSSAGRYTYQPRA